MIAGLPLVSSDWCCREFFALEIEHDLRDWALRALAEWAWVEDLTVPQLLLEWMREQGIERPVRPEEAFFTEALGAGLEVEA